MPNKIKKRNGVVVPFDSSKIRNAIQKANQAVGEEPMGEKTLNALTKEVSGGFSGHAVPTVEEVQDRV